ncbi:MULTISPECIES: DUF4097 family beta strand repeat-containing protein [Stenotrophomonas]|jgi:hypothetical protein|uniref:DUF4097 family beta strand repeat-containing protein n=1 Tax=Stenotrophomonas aracearum TaxID=3003272 RepID=A0ABY9YAM3_9GAMM|nr:MULTISPECIES: DUF4097 family beta strand repeat-containing protein [unclassified Stenotrophomonas]WNH47745.1 DUF4097 family beta strand repeat-containing protein [Stenotrophomonas sp. A5588]
MPLSKRYLVALALLLPLAAQAATRVDERHPLAAGGRVELSNIAGKVTVRGWDRNEVALSGSLADGLRLQQDKSANRVRWEVIYPRNGNSGGATLELRVPRSVEVQLGTVSADIDVAEVDLRRLQANAVSGDVAASGRSGETNLASVSGSIRSQVQTPRLELRAVSGSIQAGGGAGDVSVGTVSGNITLDAAKVQRLAAEAVSGSLKVGAAGLAPGGKVTLETVSGSISLSLPAQVSARLAVKTFSGGISSPVGQVERPRYGPGRSLDARLGGGDGDISINAHSGSVKVTLGGR